MANEKISGLDPATTPLAGTELIEIVQGGVNKKVAVSNIGGGSTPNLEEVLTEGNTATDKSIVLQSSTVDRYTEYGDNGVSVVNNDTQTSAFCNDINVGISNADDQILLYPEKIEYTDATTGYNTKIIFETPSSLGNNISVKDAGASDQQIAFVSDILTTLLAGISASIGTFTSSNTILEAFGKVKYLIDNLSTLILGQVLTGFTGAAGTVTSSDSILSAFNKIVGNLALKVDKNRFIFQGKTSITGVTGENVIFTMKVDANTYGASDAFNFYMTPLKSVTATTVEYRTYIGTSAGALTKQIGRVIANATTLTLDYKRLYHLDSGLLDCSVGFTTNATTGYNQNTSVNSPLATCNPASDFWITVTGNPTLITEVIGVMDASINPLK